MGAKSFVILDMKWNISLF